MASATRDVVRRLRGLLHDAVDHHGLASHGPRSVATGRTDFVSSARRVCDPPTTFRFLSHVGSVAVDEFVRVRGQLALPGVGHGAGLPQVPPADPARPAPHHEHLLRGPVRLGAQRRRLESGPSSVDRSSADREDAAGAKDAGGRARPTAQAIAQLRAHPVMFCSSKKKYKPVSTSLDKKGTDCCVFGARRRHR